MMYLWMKWLHIIAVISWMAGILYLYRLLIYHRERGVNSREIHDLLSLMEYRLYTYITRPAMWVSFLAGVVMIWLNPLLLSGGWLHVKLTAVVLLMGATHAAGKLSRLASVKPDSLPSSKALRIANEVPTVLMLVIVGMVVFKAF
jgi:protoporphyrinogen IX oxidase